MNIGHPPPQSTERVDPAADVDQLWYKDAVIYQIHVKSFADANNDGIGDFSGLISRLDYIAELGVNTIWLLPFYPSPRLDDGYDIADYRGVHPDYGNLADVKRFIAAAHDRGIRVIAELVVNHTSDQHPWFQRARLSKPGSIYRDFYVWSNDDRKYAGTRIIFVDSERSNWTWDDTAKAYYWHRFYYHQPDLNFDNPRVMREVLSVLRYWVELGIDGLRLDAVPYLVEREGTNSENLPETHAALKRIRAELTAHYPDKMLLAEANQWPEDTKDYFGDGDECHMAFHFPLMPRMYMAIAREDRFPITDILRQTPDIPENCQWAIFLRNHDELTLEMVTESERDFLWETYAADRRARLNLGIRRRLAPLLERDRRRIELMNYLLLSMPGTPVIYYGDEIGMGDNIHLGDRNGVRTPMQWSPDRNGGFSRVADPSRLVLPMVMDPLYAYQAVNVETQAADPHSLLMWMRRVIAVRRQYKVFGRGTYRLLYPKNRKILGYLREHDGIAILCVANLSRTPQAVELDLSEFQGRVPIELDGHSQFPPIGQLTYLLTLPPYGFYWFVLSEADDWPSHHTPAPEPMPEYQTIVMRHSLPDAVMAARLVIEHEALPQYLAKRRWFALKDQVLSSTRIALMTRVPSDEAVLLEIEIEAASGTSRWLLPLGIVWGDTTAAPLPTQLALARVRRGAKVGLLTDAFALPAFPIAILAGLAQKDIIAIDRGMIRFEPTSRIAEINVPDDVEMNWVSAEQSNSSVIVGDIAIIKMFRRVTDGPHPEAEMSRHLTEQGFANTPALLGEVVRVDPAGTRHALVIAQAFVRNQGDAWTWTTDLLLRGLSDITNSDEDAAAEAAGHSDYVRFASLLGQRLGEMHLVLARPSADPAFAPETGTADTALLLAERTRAQLEAAYQAIETAQQWEMAGQQDRTTVQAGRDALFGKLPMLAEAVHGATLTRIHGDMHLGQILVVNGDVAIIDFEGEPAKPVEIRRSKDHPLRDVAGTIRSFDYASAVVKRRSLSSHAHLADEKVSAFLDSFVERATESFLIGYREAIAPAGEQAPGLVDLELLDLFLIEKAAYEVAYEAANRPTWIDVPLHGLACCTRRVLGIEAVA
ncbi:maltose alpha-D-glucosyltransferase [Rhodopila sp.]|uniref:maltose alpha-D-glucosyltransferase n=1 Tax=Rhodopila sp. TaxID=2480087 RepID=UPI003D14B17F